MRLACRFPSVSSAMRPRSSARHWSANDGDARRTIEMLGIPRKTFYDKLQRHGIERVAFEPAKGS